MIGDLPVFVIKGRSSIVLSPRFNLVYLVIMPSLLIVLSTFRAMIGVKKNTKSCNSMFKFRNRRSLSKTQHCLSQDVSNKILLCYH